jgi:RNA polymerase sigma factor (sigma-70 family)
MSQESLGSSVADRDDEPELVRQVQSYLQEEQQSRAANARLSRSWNHFFMIFNEVIRRFARTQQLAVADGDDLVQEVWLQVIRSMPDFVCAKSRPGLRTWLYQVVQNKIKDAVRHKARHPTQNLDRVLAEGHEPADPSQDPAKLFQRHETAAMVGVALEQIRGQVHQTNMRVIELHWIHGRSLAEVGEILGLTANEIQCRQYRMFARMRSWLSEAADGDNSAG